MCNCLAASIEEPILYLDFDGVLHHYDVYLDRKNRPVLRGMGVLFEYVDRLEAALNPYPHAQIVLSTSWVRVKGFDLSRERLPLGLRERVIGATWHSAFARDLEFVSWWTHEASRYDQIARDVACRKPVDWLALDDDVNDWPCEKRSHLVACDPLLGLSEPSARLSLEDQLQRLARVDHP
ncbi:HAD domain-containing protein [Dyella sp. 2YAF14]|uniref:HAD domain-containing protein n=1 Tax=Dyella sp. 2YAF14 TaxID=3233025 RepID=UPI003F8FC43D